MPLGSQDLLSSSHIWSRVGWRLLCHAIASDSAATVELLRETLGRRRLRPSCDFEALTLSSSELDSSSLQDGCVLVRLRFASLFGYVSQALSYRQVN